MYFEYEAAGCHIYYGLARGLGSAGFAVTSFFTGRAIGRFGVSILMILDIIFLAIALIVLYFFKKPETSYKEISKDEVAHNNLFSFIKTYPGFMLFVLAAVCFFFIWGLSGYLGNMLDTLFVTGVAMGIVTDLLTNNAIRFFEPTPGANDRYIMVTIRGYISFFLNILYAFVVLFFVYCIYAVINYTVIRITNNPDTVPLGVGPILFGAFYLAVDLLLIKCKHTLIDIVRKAKKANV